jgi:ubiquinone biosynthesis protein UbiJ
MANCSNLESECHFRDKFFEEGFKTAQDKLAAALARASRAEKAWLEILDEVSKLSHQNDELKKHVSRLQAMLWEKYEINYEGDVEE